MTTFDKAIRSLKKALAEEDYEFMLTEGLSSRLPQSDYDEHERYKTELNEAIQVLEQEIKTSDKIFMIANNAIYFRDDSDYLTALYEICEVIKPGDETVGAVFIEEQRS